MQDTILLVSIPKLLKKYHQINLTLLDQIMVSGVNFLTGILFARFLGIEEFGRFTLVWMAVLFLNSIQMALIISPMMSMAPIQASQDKAEYFGAVVCQQICFSFLSLMLILGGVKLSVIYYPEWEINHLALPLSMVVFFFQNQDFFRRFFFIKERHLFALVNDAISYLGQIILLLILFQTTKLNLYNILWIIAFTSAFAVLISFFLIGNIVWPKYSFFKSFFQKNWNFAKWLIASSLLQWTSGNYFIIVGGYLLGPVAVGTVKAMQTVVGITQIIYQAMENFLPSRSSQIHLLEGEKGLIRYLIKVIIIGGSFVGSILLLITLFSENLLSFLYGVEYTQYNYLMIWISIISLIGYIGLPIGSALRTIEQTGSIFFSFLLSTIVSFLIAHFLIYSLGIDGIVIGILLAKLILIGSMGFFLSIRLKQK